MENKRIGNTLVIRWQIKVVTSQNLSEYELTLVRNEPNRKVNNIPFEIENGDTLVFKHEGMEQKVCGQYSYSLYVNFDKASQSVVDSCDGYYLSQRSCGEECDEECGTLNIENEINLKSVILMVEGVPGKSAYEIAVENGFKGTEEEWLESLKGIGVNIKGELKSEEELPQKGLPSDSYIIDGDLYVYVGENGNVEVNPKWSNVGTIRGPRGMSAYEIAVKKGFVGTEEEWLESLKGKDGKPFTYADLTPEQIAELQKPATEAAKLANSAAQSADTSAENANQAALDANRAAQSAGTAASNASATNEAIQTAEGLRVQAENKRETAETQRKQNEQTRQTKEGERQTAETGRVKAEEARVTEFATLKQNAETATKEANAAAAKANQAAENVDGRVTKLEGKASQTYENYDAIVASGETDKDKIYIDGETNTSYRWNGEKYVSIGGSVDVYQKNKFIISPFKLQAYALRYIGFKDIKNDDNCYLLTVGRCLKFSLSTFEVFWDVELTGYGISWHNAAEQLRIIDGVVYILLAKYGIQNNGIILIKLNDENGTFISEEQINLKVQYSYACFLNYGCLITKDYIIGRNYVDKTIDKVNISDNSVEVITPLFQNYTYNRFIINSNGETKNAIIWIKEKNVVCIYDEDFNLYTITLTFNSTNVSLGASTTFYFADFKSKKIYFSWLTSVYNVTLTDNGDFSYSAENVVQRGTRTDLNYYNEKYNNSFLSPNYNRSKNIYDIMNVALLSRNSFKKSYFKDNKGVTSFLDADLCESSFFDCYIEILNTTD